MIYPGDPEIELRALINILDRETYDFAEEFIDLPQVEQLDRISDLRVLALTIKKIADEAAGCCKE
ncbi:hypothetical protein [Trichlorobacter lovleyi]|uniref:hypothetical protein n=1 Tax=Trichlorobacter lovleyi TaxID=313985 RepID=UPI003D0A1C97